jgi:hypothetical protein
MAIELPGGAQFTGEAKVDMGLKKIQTKLTITLNHLQGQLYLHLPCFPYTRFILCPLALAVYRCFPFSLLPPSSPF